MASRDKVSDAEECKDKGNACLKAGEYDKAIEWYKQALSLHKSHVYYSNRSAAYLSKGFADSALKDALECIEMNPTWAKGYSRKGAALHKLRKYDQAIEAYEEGLKIDPNNAGLKTGLQDVTNEKNNPTPAYGGGGGGPGGMGDLFGGLMDKVKNHPKLSSYLSDPTYVAQLEMLQSNPSNLQNVLGDPRMMETLSAVLGIQLQTPDQAAAASTSDPDYQKRRQEREEAQKKKEEEARIQKEKEEFEKLSPEEKQVVENKKKAVDAKQEGNTLYKKRDFEKAIEAYDKAIELDPSDMTFITNKAAVLLEQGKLDECLSLCKEAIEVGRKNYADYSIIAKAYARMGNACFKHKQWEEAIKHYTAAQLEHKSIKIEEMIKKAKRKQKVEEEKAYVNPELGLKAKEEGNVHFKAGKFPEAIKCYTEAVKRDPTNSTYYNNRAAAYMKLADFGRAMDDCKESIKLDPQNVKAHGRKGNIEFFLKEYHKAMDSYKAGLAIDETNKVCTEGIAKTTYAIRSNAGNQDGQRAARAMEDPEIRGIMGDPIMKQVLQDMTNDPSSAQKHMSNPEVASKIEKLIAAGIIQTK